MNSNNIERLANLFHERNNPKLPEIAFGTVVSANPVKVQLCANDNVILSDRNMRSVVDLSERTPEGQYIYLNRTVAVCPYSNNHKYLVLGVVVDG